MEVCGVFSVLISFDRELVVNLRENFFSRLKQWACPNCAIVTKANFIAELLCSTVTREAQIIEVNVHKIHRNKIRAHIVYKTELLGRRKENGNEKRRISVARPHGRGVQRIIMDPRASRTTEQSRQVEFTIRST